MKRLIIITSVVILVCLSFNACKQPKTFSEKLIEYCEKNPLGFCFPAIVRFDWDGVCIVQDNEKSVEDIKTEYKLIGHLAETLSSEDEYRVIFSKDQNIIEEYILNKNEILFQEFAGEIFYPQTQYGVQWKENENGSRLLYITVGSV